MHSGDFGDIVYYLGFVQTLAERGWDNSMMLTQEFAGQRELMTLARKRFISPLIAAQNYVELVEESFNAIGYDDFYSFKDVREHLRKSICQSSANKFIPLHDWPYLKYGVTSPNRTLPWLRVPYKQSYLEAKKYLVVSRSARYHNPNFPWYDLNQFADRAVFVGTSEEHEAFCKKQGIGMLYAPISNALELAQLIDNAAAFIGNQSLPLAIAEGLKKPVLVEDSIEHPDCDIHRAGHISFFQGKYTVSQAVNFIQNALQ